MNKTSVLDLTFYRCFATKWETILYIKFATQTYKDKNWQYFGSFYLISYKKSMNKTSVLDLTFYRCFVTQWKTTVHIKFATQTYKDKNWRYFWQFLSYLLTMFFLNLLEWHPYHKPVFRSSVTLGVLTLLRSLPSELLHPGIQPKHHQITLLHHQASYLVHSIFEQMDIHK